MTGSFSQAHHYFVLLMLRPFPASGRVTSTFADPPRHREGLFQRSVVERSWSRTMPDRSSRTPCPWVAHPALPLTGEGVSDVGIGRLRPFDPWRTRPEPLVLPTKPQ